ncbi:MAG: M20/M25/M40 family metallo-hydrolase [Chloroflexi bacterium]|nr:M20/M25/M40 family metallo-hydrolase [Chloroflexota bacterium]
MTPNWDAVRQEVTGYLQDLVRIDTTNPPGNETLAAEYLAAVLQREGIQPTIVESAPGRGNLVARLRGDGRAAPLMLMVHLDVVTAEADQWTRPPFSGDVSGGYLWGRGTLDAKELAAMELATLLLLKRAGRPLARDIIFMANADEETGGKLGAGWMVKHHADLICAEYAINEGGGFGLDILGERFFTCQVAEKGTARFAMRTRGRPGHGSQPTRDNAVLKLADAIQKIGATELPLHATATTRLFVGGVAAKVERHYGLDLQALLEPRKYRVAVERLPIDDGLRAMFYAMLHNTVTPTMLNAGCKINVIPSVAEARCDARVLPGQSAQDLLAEVRGVVGKEVEIEFLDDTPALETEYRTPLFETIRCVMKRYAPRATLLPYLVTGATDARHVSKLGTKVYGFGPMLGPTAELDRIHGHDERISIENLAFGTRVLYDIVSEFCGGERR